MTIDHPARRTVKVSLHLPALLTLALLTTVLAGCSAVRDAERSAGSGGSIFAAAGSMFSLSSNAPQRTYFARSLDEDDRAALAADAPNLTIVSGLTRDEALARAAEAHGIDGPYASPEMLRAATNLEWVQSTSAGVERYIAIPELRTSESIVLTNMQGVHGPTIADHVFGMLLVLTRDLRYYVDPAQRGTWNRDGSGEAVPVALAGRTLLVAGLGGIGREVAQRGKGFGMRVLATRRSAVPPPPYVDRQGTPDDLDAFLAEADVVVLSVPLTDETRGMIGARELALLPEGAFLVNVARGPVVDTAALVAALESGRLAGACLDVTDPEPLPADHVLWTMPNVVITPHVSSRSALTREQWRAVYLDNLRRFARGASLRNVVDKAAGY